MTSSYRVFTNSNYAYFVTCTIVEWLPILVNDPYRRIVLDSLSFLRENKGVQLNAFIVMPTHVHAILWPDQGINLSNVLRDFKRFTSRSISTEAVRRDDQQFLGIFARKRQDNRAQGESQYQVWQEGSHPEAIYSFRFASQKIIYIHENPVRSGLVKCPEEWPYSSVRAYLYGEETYPSTDIIVAK